MQTHYFLGRRFRRPATPSSNRSLHSPNSYSPAASRIEISHTSMGLKVMAGPFTPLNSPAMIRTFPAEEGAATQFSESPPAKYRGETAMSENKEKKKGAKEKSWC